MNRPTRNTRILMTAALAITATLAMTGCFKSLYSNTPGGNMRSTDSFTYISTPFEPLTVTLYDHRDDEPLWTVDVPIGQKVTIRFLENRAKDGTTRRPDIMQWAIYDQTKRRASLENTMAVPGPDARLLKVSIRDGIEYPEEKTKPQQFPDPDRQWVPIEPRRFRGVPLDDNARSGSYISDN